MPKSTKTVLCDLSLAHLWRKTHPCSCCGLPLHWDHARKSFSAFQKTTKKASFWSQWAVCCNFLSLKNVLCHLMGSPWVPWQELSWVTISPMYAWKQTSFYTWELICLNSTFTPWQEPRWDRCLFQSYTRGCCSLLENKSKAYLKASTEGRNPGSKVKLKRLLFFLFLPVMLILKEMFLQ